MSAERIERHDTAPLEYPFERDEPLRPPPRLLELQRQPSLPRIRLWDGTVARLITRYADAKAALASPHASSDYSLPGFPAYSPHRKWRPDMADPEFQPLLTDLDGPVHARLRRVVAAEFSVKRVRRLEDMLVGIVDSALDDLEAAGSPADLMAVVLKKIPSELIGELLGFPEPERPQWRAWFEKWVAPATAADERRATHERMLSYVEEQLARRLEQPRDDFISRLVAAEAEGTIAHKEVRMLVFLLYAAGFDTTANSMGFGILELLTNPEQADRLRTPDADWRLAVEEMFRTTSILQIGMARIAHDGPIDVPSGRIEEGEGVIISLMAANYDPELFPDPAKFDPTRDARDQIGFSHGPHQCVGQQLARQEMYVLLPRLLQRFATLRLDAEAADLEYLPNGTRVVTSLPVAW